MHFGKEKNSLLNPKHVLAMNPGTAVLTRGVQNALGDSAADG